MPQDILRDTAHVGPLRDQRLENIAFDIFGFKYPAQTYWDNAMHAERSECRRIALKMADRLQASWTVQTALEQLTAQSINVLFAGAPIDEAQRRIIEDYAASYIEDLVPLGMGNSRAKSTGWQHVPEDEDIHGDTIEDLGTKKDSVQ